MAIPEDWAIVYSRSSSVPYSYQPVSPCAFCPHCRKPSTFSVQSHFIYQEGGKIVAHLIMLCNAAQCRKVVYVLTSCNGNTLKHVPGDEFFMHPSRSIDPPHPSVPTHVAEDWIEAQKALEVGAVKAAAVMCRRVLYGVLLDKKCKEHPLQEGLQQLIASKRLSAIFDEWLPAIKDDGHDAAHPHRALKVSPSNIIETMVYTAELLRFVYVEPYEFKQRKARNAATATP